MLTATLTATLNNNINNQNATIRTAKKDNLNIKVAMASAMGTFSENLWVLFYGYISDKRSARNVPIKKYP